MTSLAAHPDLAFYNLKEAFWCSAKRKSILLQFEINGAGDVVYFPEGGLADVRSIVLQFTPLQPNAPFYVFDLEIEACCIGMSIFIPLYLRKTFFGR